jgi:[NiFe] hydrogenase diaphorase moiety small subunit
MSNIITFTIDGVEVRTEPGQTIIQAADAAGIYIPRLCYMKGIIPHGACRVCTVLVNGRPQSACTQPAAEGAVVENNIPRLTEFRKNLIEMLFVEGNHYCMFCEKSGNCELQAMAYRFGIAAPRYPYLFPIREADATHKDILIDRNRCILCGRCVNASRTVDHKSAFGFAGRGINKKVVVNSNDGLGGTDAAVTDKAAEVCPVGCIIKKRTAFATPIGKRLYDTSPIGSEITKK